MRGLDPIKLPQTPTVFNDALKDSFFSNRFKRTELTCLVSGAPQVTLQFERWESVQLYYCTQRLFPWVLEIEVVVQMEEDCTKVRLEARTCRSYSRFSCRAELALFLPNIFHQNAKHIRPLHFIQFHTAISGSIAVTNYW